MRRYLRYWVKGEGLPPAGLPVLSLSFLPTERKSTGIGIPSLAAPAAVVQHLVSAFSLFSSAIGLVRTEQALTSRAIGPIGGGLQ